MPKTLGEVMEEEGLKSVDVTFHLVCPQCGGVSFSGVIGGPEATGLSCDACGARPGLTQGKESAP